jgi:hypothetical protein
MKMLALLLCVALAGCANQDITIEPSNRYAKLEPTAKLEASAVPLPTPSKLSIKTVDGAQVAVLDATGVNKLIAYETASKQNAEALSLLITAHNGLVDQRNLMLQTLTLEESRANFFAQKYAESENTRRKQYDEMQTELIIHKAMIIFMGIFLVL